ncbi:MAG TPA: GAF domain-containing protein [Phycisphaerae bacterium]|nr:GAF domain-containing protein [Phycisphaerae bacterium]
MHRDYADLLKLIRVTPDRRHAMQAFVDALWPALNKTGVSWMGFYLRSGPDELTLGPRRDKPACSPIGLHGACGQALISKKPLVVRDVAELGAGYIACDPMDQSEIVIPLLDENGDCWGVFDADSHEIGAFTNADADGLTALLREAELTK